jgi:ribosomal protein S8
VIAYVLSFIRNAKASRENRQSGKLATLEIDSAMTAVIKQVQVEGFAQEFKEISRGNQVTKQRKLLALSPFLDKEGVIRVGGQTQKASIANDQKHQILLP